MDQDIRYDKVQLFEPGTLVRLDLSHYILIKDSGYGPDSLIAANYLLMSYQRKRFGANPLAMVLYRDVLDVYYCVLLEDSKFWIPVNGVLGKATDSARFSSAAAHSRA